MSEKTIFIRDLKPNTDVKSSFIIMKRLYKDGHRQIYLIADKSGDVKAAIQNSVKVEVGSIVAIEGKYTDIIEVKKVTEMKEYDIHDYLPAVNRDIEEIMMDIEELSEKYIISEEGKALNDYFFKNEEFLQKFKRGIGGVSMHHNYVGGLAEHTLNVMYLTSVLCDRYNCRRKEMAILAAKLHDIGKIYELEYDGHFKYSLRGELEGHIVIGVCMIDEAINANKELYSEDFEHRIRGCIVQHHGKLEYGSPRASNMEESFILNFADNIDATMNKIEQLREKTKENEWSEYDRRIETKLYL